MPNEHGEWILYGVDENDPYCLHTIDDLVAYINEIGFLPLFKNEVPGFSVEERTVPYFWWSDNEKKDPWKWREIIARQGKIAYGKFFNKKAGFISKKWIPYFANYRRDGYDFDALCDDEKATVRYKKIMSVFDDGKEKFSFEIKKNAGFGKGGEKNFEGTITDLQMMTYVCLRDFRQRINKKGEAYGWSVAVYDTFENMFGTEHVRSKYCMEPLESRQYIVNHLKNIYPIAREEYIIKILG